VKVVIAPYDPRVRPLEVDYPDLPEWTADLYHEITDEIMAVTDADPVKVSSSRPLSRSDRSIR
jgi:hypothetical protein